MTDELRESIAAAQATWNRKAVGSQRATALPGTREYFEQIRAYRYGYETPFIPTFFDFPSLNGRKVLEIGVGHGIDGAEMARHGALYTGIDVTRNHLSLAEKNFQLNGLSGKFIQGDLLEADPRQDFDAVYSFGVMHHISAEAEYLLKARELLKPDGRLLIAVYSKWSFFNVYMVADWLLRGRRRPLDDWRSQIAELSEPGHPVTIKIRSRRQVQNVLEAAGFRVEKYGKKGFVQNYLPIVGKQFAPDGRVLDAFAAVLGWYHCFICRVTPSGNRKT
jgi:2-polyprenyl-3-methyl-5-hydroxy-6-metoxy-1,4-benzoquinol methylase